MTQVSHCPRCGSDRIEIADFRDIEGEFCEGEGRVCQECGWEGHENELEDE